jgi:hypothetical protein
LDERIHRAEHAFDLLQLEDGAILLLLRPPSTEVAHGDGAKLGQYLLLQPQVPLRAAEEALCLLTAQVLAAGGQLPPLLRLGTALLQGTPRHGRVHRTLHARPPAARRELAHKLLDGAVARSELPDLLLG